jgi:hypothetical protein
MNAPRFRKVCDIPTAAASLQVQLRNYLMSKRVHHKTVTFTKRGIVRFMVHENDLCFAKSAALALGLRWTGTVINPSPDSKPEGKAED